MRHQVRVPHVWFATPIRSTKGALAGKRYSPPGLPCLLLFGLLTCQISAFGAAAHLSAPEVVVPEGSNEATVPILLAEPAEQRVAALQFDIEFDSNAMAVSPVGAIAESDALKGAGKQIHYSVVSPGKIRVLVIGFNETPIPPGEVASVRLRLDPLKMAARQDFTITNALLANPAGQKVPVQCTAGVLASAAYHAQAAAPRQASSLAWPAAAGVAALLAAGLAVRMRRRQRGRPTRATSKKTRHAQRNGARLLFLLIVTSIQGSNATTVGVGSITSAGGGAMAVPIQIVRGQESVGAVQFDFRYDPARYAFVEAEAGRAAAGAGKDAMFTEVQPGVVRVIVAGMNEQSMASGTIATLHFESLAPGASFAELHDSASLERVTVSDPAGKENETLLADQAEPDVKSEPDKTGSEESGEKEEPPRTGTVEASGTALAKESGAQDASFAPGIPGATGGRPVTEQDRRAARPNIPPRARVFAAPPTGAKQTARTVHASTGGAAELPTARADSTERPPRAERLARVAHHAPRYPDNGQTRRTAGATPRPALSNPEAEAAPLDIAAAVPAEQGTPQKNRHVLLYLTLLATGLSLGAGVWWFRKT